MSEETIVVDPDKDYYTELVGDDKKYKTPQDAGRALVHKDAFIQQLQREAEEARNELQARLSLEEQIKEVRSQLEAKPPEATPPSTDDIPQSPEPAQNAPTQEPLDIKKLLDEELAKRDAQAKQAQAQSTIDTNRNAVKDSLTKVYGPGFEAVIQQKAAEMNVDMNTVNYLVDHEPQAFYNLLGLPREIPQGQHETPRTQVNTANLGSTSTERNSEYYDRLRKEDPKKYFSGEIQRQRFEDAKRLGENF